MRSSQKADSLFWTRFRQSTFTETAGDCGERDQERNKQGCAKSDTTGEDLCLTRTRSCLQIHHLPFTLYCIRFVNNTSIHKVKRIIIQVEKATYPLAWPSRVTVPLDTGKRAATKAQSTQRQDMRTVSIHFTK